MECNESQNDVKWRGDKGEGGKCSSHPHEYPPLCLRDNCFS